MRHARLIVHRLDVDDEEVTVSLATLVAVRREGSPGLDWEIVAETVGASEPQLESNQLRLVVVSGAADDGTPELSELTGPAVVVRYVEGTVVWRGDGQLVGFEENWLS